MALIFQTRFENSLDVDFPKSAPHPPNYRRIAGRGINYGYALTCGSALMIRQNSPYLGTELKTMTSRIQWGLAGNLYDGATGISGIPGLEIMSWYDPIDANSMNSGAFHAYLLARDTGAVSLWINRGGFGPSAGTVVTSVPGIFVYDGRMNGIQCSLSIGDHTSVTYNVVVNNVSVLSGTVVANIAIGSILGGCPAMHTWAVTDGITLCLERASITEMSFRGSQQPPGGTYHWQTSVAEYQLDDTVNIISYPPCNAANATESGQCSPIIAPPPDLSGVYFMNPTNTHDKYNGGIDKKIPNPTIKTTGVGE